MKVNDIELEKFPMNEGCLSSYGDHKYSNIYVKPVIYLFEIFRWLMTPYSKIKFCVRGFYLNICVSE